MPTYRHSPAQGVYCKAQSCKDNLTSYIRAESSISCHDVMLHSFRVLSPAKVGESDITHGKMDKKEAVETLLIADSAVTSTAPATSWFRRLRGNWRTTVRLGAVGAACVLALNISLLEWARRHGPAVDGIVTVFSGSCKRSKTVTLWADLAINM